MNYKFNIVLIVLVLLISISIIGLIKITKIQEEENIIDRLNYCNFKGYSQYIIDKHSELLGNFVCYNSVNDSLDVDIKDYYLYLNIKKNSESMSEKENLINS